MTDLERLLLGELDLVLDAPVTDAVAAAVERCPTGWRWGAVELDLLAEHPQPDVTLCWLARDPRPADAALSAALDPDECPHAFLELDQPHQIERPPMLILPTLSGSLPVVLQRLSGAGIPLPSLATHRALPAGVRVRHAASLVGRGAQDVRVQLTVHEPQALEQLTDLALPDLPPVLPRSDGLRVQINLLDRGQLAVEDELDPPHAAWPWLRRWAEWSGLPAHRLTDLSSWVEPRTVSLRAHTAFRTLALKAVFGPSGLAKLKVYACWARM